MRLALKKKKKIKIYFSILMWVGYHFGYIWFAESSSGLMPSLQIFGINMSQL